MTNHHLAQGIRVVPASTFCPQSTTRKSLSSRRSTPRGALRRVLRRGTPPIACGICRVPDAYLAIVAQIAEEGVRVGASFITCAVCSPFEGKVAGPCIAFFSFDIGDHCQACTITLLMALAARRYETCCVGTSNSSTRSSYSCTGTRRAFFFPRLACRASPASLTLVGLVGSRQCFSFGSFLFCLAIHKYLAKLANAFPGLLVWLTVATFTLLATLGRALRRRTQAHHMWGSDFTSELQDEFRHDKDTYFLLIPLSWLMY